MRQDDSFRIRPVLADRREEALELVFSAFSPAEAALQIAEVQRDEPHSAAPWEGLLGAFRGPQLIGAVLAQIQAGRVASALPPRLRLREAPLVAQELLRAMLDRLRSKTIRMAQCLLRTGQEADRALLERSDFRHLADLLYLACLGRLFPATQPASPLRFHAYEEHEYKRLADIVEATYESTLDCPGLNGLRTIDEVLAGYRATGHLAQNRWFIIEANGQDLGCLLLDDHAQHGVMELVYMGVLPSARGHGWGRHIVRFAEWVAGQSQRERLVLAVDAENQPALAMYAAAGFEAWDQRRVYVFVFDEGSPR